MNNKLIELIQTANREIEQVAREIYYAMSYLPHNHPARVNLNQALKILGISSPRDVELSYSILSRNIPRIAEIFGIHEYCKNNGCHLNEDEKSNWTQK